MKKNIKQSLLFSTIIVLEITVIIFIIKLYSANTVKKTQNIEVQNIAAETNVHQVIEETLDKVAHDLISGTDVNKDGLINCIDAAVLFYQYYPVKSEAAIILNYNPPAMNHLFNMVLVEGVPRTIEPQAKLLEENSFWMSEVWKENYNSSFDELVTDNYIKFVK